MAKLQKPTEILLRTYQVGFGDCFLLSFIYSETDERHVLIDFGSTGFPKEWNDEEKKDHMFKVAEQIRTDCKGKLSIVVATHRHKDHISGFSTEKKNDNGESTGSIIASCEPDLIIQPWTENPELGDGDVKVGKLHHLVKDEDVKSSPEKNFVATLANMESVAKLVGSEAERLRKTNVEDDAVNYVTPITKEKSQQLSFFGENNIRNKSAVENLMKMGERQGAQAIYVNFGMEKDFDFSEILPGVKVHILGPPTLEQHHEIMKMRSDDDEEFWMLQSITRNFWGVQSMTAQLVGEMNGRNDDSQDRLFPKAGVYQNFAPSHTRWFIQQVRDLRADQLLGIVRILDKAMNNTSVIMLFEVGKKKLLFPGDAQIENWEYALNKPDVRKLLRDTTLYKVGHHGSRNATPKTLWKNFSKKSKTSNLDRLKTINSTMEGKHGHTVETAVPRETLVKELEVFSDYHTTQNIKTEEGLSETIEIKI